MPEPCARQKALQDPHVKRLPIFVSALPVLSAMITILHYVAQAEALCCCHSSFRKVSASGSTRSGIFLYLRYPRKPGPDMIPDMIPVYVLAW